jgi:hypothetical protein
VEKEEKWITPELTVFGSVQDITKGDIPPKEFGGSDGAVWMQQSVGWAS